MRSIRSRLTAYLLGGVGLLIVAAGLLLQSNLRGWLESEFDEALEAKARALMTLTKQERGEVELDFADEMMPEFEDPVDPHYFELWLDGDTLLERSRSFKADEERSRTALPRTPDLDSVPRFQDVSLPDGRPGRLVRVDFVPQVEDDVGIVADELQPGAEPTRDPAKVRPGSGLHAATLLVARERQTLASEIGRLRWSFLVLMGLLLGGVAAAVALALKIGLRPLERLAREVRTLDAESLHRRLGAEEPPRELAPVVEQLDALLHRLEAAFRRERRLTSDIAHELKTPIAELRNLCEVGARWPDDAELARKFFDDAWKIGLQMERIVVNLLALTRYDEGADVTLRPRRVKIARAIDDVWEPMAKDALERRLELDNEVPASAVIETDPDKFRIIVSNLLANAVAYSRPGTAVTCGFKRSNGSTSLSFSNFAADLEADDLPVMFDRFWRRDEARTGELNVGLGLAIVRAFANQLRFDIETSLAPDDLFQVTLTRPEHRADRLGDRASSSSV